MTSGEGHQQRPCWFVGAHFETAGNQTKRFVRDGVWEMEKWDAPAHDKYVQQVKSMQSGDRIAIKSTYVQFGECHIRSLDEEGGVPLRPDLTWWNGSCWTFVGDVKYKRLDTGIPNADLYQLLAYATAVDLPGGLLIYARGESEPAMHTVRHSGKRLEVAALDLSGSLDGTLARIGDLAQRITGLRRAA